MHDPWVVVFEIRRPWPQRSKGFSVHRGRRWKFSGAFWTLAGRTFYWPDWVTVWHVEPKGADSGTVCKGMGGSGLSWRNLKFAVRHWHHLKIHVQPYRRVKRWLFDHCAECGYRFLWKSDRCGYMSSDKVYHGSCMALRQARSQLEDAARALTFTADRTERWRVERWLEHREQQQAKADA